VSGDIRFQSVVVLVVCYLILRTIFFLGLTPIGAISGVVASIFYVVRVEKSMGWWKYVVHVLLLIGGGMFLQGVDMVVLSLRHIIAV